MATLALHFGMSPPSLTDDFVDRFHAGERSALEQCYRDCARKALETASRILSTVDAETVTHEVFYRILSDDKTRASFTGGSLCAWIATSTRNAAIDLLRRKKREVSEVDAPSDDTDGRARVDEEVEAKMLIERFKKERLPTKYAGLFQARFIEQLPQREAAELLSMQRSTLAYQEEQVRALLTAFLLEEDA